MPPVPAKSANLSDLFPNGAPGIITPVPANDGSGEIQMPPGFTFATNAGPAQNMDKPEIPGEQTNE